MSAYPNTATKVELVEAHREKMRLRRIHRYTRTISARYPWYWKPKKQTLCFKAKGGFNYEHNFEYTKSIWPKNKTVNAGRMLNGQVI